MSNAKNINEVSVITSVDSGDYVMVSDISDDSLKRATVTDVGKELLGTTDISAIGDGSVTGAISDLDSTKLDLAGGTMTGGLTVRTPSANSGITLGHKNDSSYYGYINMARNGYYTILTPNSSLASNATVVFPSSGGTLALTSNLPQIVTLYSGTAVQANVTFTMPSGFTPLFYFISVSNSSGASGARSTLVLPVGAVSYFALTSGYVRLSSSETGVSWLAGDGNSNYVHLVTAFGYYS